MNKAIDLRSKCRHFRILIIGRANAGKTTILKKVCNSIEDPEIFSPSGQILDPATVQESSERGLHDIENQLIFKSNRQFIFHDSRGFESGSVDEMRIVHSFITKRAESTELAKQLHAIWYCVPTDTDRPVLEADKMFFDDYGSGRVPVVAIFTKFDGLVTTAYNELRKHLGIKEAKNKSFGGAKEKLNANFIEPLMATTFRPSNLVRLDDMRDAASNCAELIEKTASVLNDDTLKLLFVSVQENNIKLCIRYAVRGALQVTKGEDDKTLLRCLVEDILAWFPHVWMNFEYDKKKGLEGRKEMFFSNVTSCTKVLLNELPSLETSLQTPSGRAELIAALSICAEQTFTQASAKRRGFSPAFSIALSAYLKSTVKDDVIKAIGALPQGSRPLEEQLWHIITKQPIRINADTP